MDKFKVYLWKNIPSPIRKSGNEKSSFKDYMIVNVFNNYEEMYNYVDKREKHKVDRDYVSRCYCIDHVYENLITGERKYTPLCGDLYFVKDYMGGATVSHECCHAVIGYFNRKIKNKNNLFEDIPDDLIYEDCLDIEELFCYMQGSLVNQIYNYYYKNIVEDKENDNNKNN